MLVLRWWGLVKSDVHHTSRLNAWEGSSILRTTRAAFLLVLPIVLAACADDPREELLTTRIRDQAAYGAKAFERGDYETVVDQTYPTLVEQIGGRAQMIAAVKTAMEEMKAKGFQFAGFDFDEPTEPVASNGKLFSVVPETMTLATRDATYTQESFMLGVSVDDGVTWKFIDGTTLTPTDLPKLVPDLPPRVRLPKPEPPVLHKRK